jgi:2-dehydropantoate 2-reductase
MRICVFGAGAIGGHLAGRLAKGGAEVSVVARGAQLDAIRRDGLRVEVPDGAIHARIAASDEPAALGTQDAVIVTVKAPALPSVARTIGPLLGPETPVVFAMNGVPWWYFHAHGGPLDGRRLSRIDPDGLLWEAVGPDRAIGGVVYSACTVTAPGLVEVETANNRLVLGEPDGAISARAEAIAALLRAGGLRVEMTDRIRDAVWSKLLLNLVAGPLCVLAQAEQRAVMSEPACADAARRILEEGAAIARAMDCEPRYDPDRIIAGAAVLAHKPSIVQDLERGRPMEIDALFVAPLELARMAGVSTPTLDLVVTLAKIRARQAGLYRD